MLRERQGEAGHRTALKSEPVGKPGWGGTNGEPLTLDRKRALAWAAVAVAVLGSGGYWSFMALWASEEASKSTTCASNLKTRVRGLLICADDHDGLFPPGDQWVEASSPRQWGDRRMDQGCLCARSLAFGYAMSSDVVDRPVWSIVDPAKSALAFDSSLPGSSPIGDLDSLPDPPRHGGLPLFGGVELHNNVVFADGRLGRMKRAKPQ